MRWSDYPGQCTRNSPDRLGATKGDCTPLFRRRTASRPVSTRGSRELTESDPRFVGRVLVRLARRGWWAPGVGGVLQRVGIDIDGHEPAGTVGEELAQRGGVFEHARAGQRGVMLTGCDLV